MTPTTFIQPDMLSLSAEQWKALAPFVVLFGGILLTIILSVIKFLAPKWSVFLVSIATLIAGIVSSLELLHGEKVFLFGQMMVADRFGFFFSVIFFVTALVTILASFRYLDKEGIQHPEYYVLVLLSTLGMMLLATSLDLIVVFIALELMSLAVYCLVGFRRTDRKSNEAAVKYFILGSAASAVMLYGTALLFGSTGTINIAGILTAIQGNPALMTPVFSLGVLLVLIGFLFKVASVPFHSWMPDVYEGAPTPITGFMTTGLKAAAFAAFLRVIVTMGYGRGFSELIQSNLHDFLWVSAALTMLIGNLVALTQTNLKRMLAYSSIAHTGYILVGMLVGPSSDAGYAPVVLYLVTYAVMNLGAFIVLTLLSGREDHGLNLHDISGLSGKHPWLSFALALFMLSMAGIPPTAGFAAKYYLLYSSVQAGEIWLTVLAVLCSAISVYYYLRVLVHLYMKDAPGSKAHSRMSGWAVFALSTMVFLTLQIGIMPSRLLEAAKKAVTSL